MAQLLQKVALISLATLLAACSTDNNDKRQLNGDDSYLKAPPPQELKAPAGMIIPVQFADYNIPLLTTKGSVGKELDIRPPTLALALITGSRVQVMDANKVGLLVDSNAKNQNLWSQVLKVIQDNGYSVTSSQETSLTTDWISWPRKDEDTPYQGRYSIELQPQGYQSTLSVTTTELRHNGEVVTDAKQLNRYTVMMLNRLSYSIGQLQNSKTDTRSVEVDKVSSFTVQNATDETGLAMMVVRTPYTGVWNSLPAALTSIGMESGSRNRSQGTVVVKYKVLSESKLEALGVIDPKLKNGEYTLQVGDLNNRTSLQFRDSKGQPIDETTNNALVPLMEAALNQTSAIK